MLEAEISVAVAHPSGVRALLEERGALLEEGELPALDLRRLLLREDLLGPRLFEVLAHVAPDHVRSAEAGDPRVRGAALGVEGGDRLGDPIDLRDREGALLEPDVGALLVREPHHVNRVVDDLSLAADPVRAAFDRDRRHPEVDVGGEAPIELDLRLAGGAALLARGEVEEAEVDRLLHLVDVVAEHEDPRDVGLEHAIGVRRQVFTEAAHDAPRLGAQGRLSTRASPQAEARSARAAARRLGHLDEPPAEAPRAVPERVSRDRQPPPVPAQDAALAVLSRRAAAHLEPPRPWPVAERLAVGAHPSHAEPAP